MNTPIDGLQDLCCAPYSNGIEPAIAAGMTECRFATEGGVIHYWVSASPSPKRGWMVFLPGLSADHTLFNLQFGHFAQKWNLIVWDAPAHGLSRPWNHPLSIDSMAEALGAILEKNRAANPIIAGQSLGGYVAQAFIDLYPGCHRYIPHAASLLQKMAAWHTAPYGSPLSTLGNRPLSTQPDGTCLLDHAIWQT